MYCEHCGRELPPGAADCPGCGHRRAGEDIRSQWLSISSLVLVLVGFNIAAIITGLVSLFTRRPGRPFAVAGVAVAVLRTVIGVVAMLLMLWFGLFAYLADKAEDRGTRPLSGETRGRREQRWKGKLDFDCHEDDTGLNVDTSLAGRRKMVVRGVEQELLELEESADDLEDALGEDWSPEQDSLLELAWDGIDSARGAIPDIEDAEDDDELEESAAEAHRHLLAVGKALRELGRR